MFLIYCLGFLFTFAFVFSSEGWGSDRYKIFDTITISLGYALVWPIFWSAALIGALRD